MKKNVYIKKILLLSISTFLLAACGNNTESEVEEEPTGQSVETPQSSENQDNNNESDDQKNNDENELQNDTTSSQNEIDSGSEAQEDEAVENVLTYLEEQEGYDTEGLRISLEEGEEGEYRAQVFGFAPEDGEQQATQTIGWYVVDKQTGEVEKVEDSEEEVEEQGKVSEIVYMSDEERKNHHKNLAVSEENLSDTVLDNLILPGIHENTVYYEGRVNPGDSIIVYLVNPENPTNADRLDVNPEVDEEGYFSIDLSEYTLDSTNAFRISLTGGYPQEQTFDIPINEAQEGMEAIGVRE